MKRLILAIACMMVSVGAYAEKTTKHYGDEVLSKEQFIDALKPKPKYKLRGIGFTQPSEPQSLALSVHFAYDSADLTEQALAQLNPLGEALNSEQLAAFAFAIDGHTDAVGADEYNMTLSQRRALAVGNYLYENFGVDATRLNLTGKGESELYDPAQPESAVNRRVEITTIETQQQTQQQ